MIPAKDKAEELVEKFRECDINEVEYSWISLEGAKKCALFVVEEILSLPSLDEGRMIAVCESDYNYWIQVKQEIEKI